MRPFRLSGIWIGLLVPTTVLSAQEKPLTPEELEKAAKYIVTGRVERVYTSEKKIDKDSTDALYAIEVSVDKVKKAEGPGRGNTIFVRTWKADKRPPGWKGNPGQATIPARGDLVELYLTGGDSPFDAVTPNGIQVVTPGTKQSKSTGMEMVLVNAGQFRMGAPDEEPGRQPDEYQHRTRLTRPFYLGVYEVTQEQYRKVTGNNPSWFTSMGGGKDKVAGQDTTRFPVESVTWFDAVSFCNQLSARDGFEPYYKIADERREGDAIRGAAVTVAGGNGYRLPTEAEWELACRAGTATPFHFGRENANGRLANTRAAQVPSGYGTEPKWKELARTTAVGSYPANEWGFHDGHGNVAEWCWDWYDRHYGPATADDPKGPATGRHRVVRGGSWLVMELGCRSASRFWYSPDENKYDVGFRVARNP